MDRIVVASWWVNHPEMLELHRAVWEDAFVGDQVRYIVYIDTPIKPCDANFGDSGLRQKIIDECRRLQIEYYEVPPDLHLNRRAVIPQTVIPSDDTTASARDCVVTHYAWIKHMLEEGVERYVMTQPDIFPYKRVSWNQITGGRAFFYKPQDRSGLQYAWNGLCCINRNKWSEVLLRMINFDWGFHNGIFTDSGGGTWRLVQMLDEDEKLEWSGLNSLHWGSHSKVPEFPYWVVEHLKSDPRNEMRDGKEYYYSEIQHDWCIHLRAGCNWDGVGGDVHAKRYSNFRRLLQEAIQDNSVFI